MPKNKEPKSEDILEGHTNGAQALEELTAPEESQDITATLDELMMENIEPVFSAAQMVDEDEDVCQRAVKAIGNGVITAWRPLIDKGSGQIRKNEETNRAMQEPLDPRQATVWQTSFQDRGVIPADIQFPDNPSAQSFELMCTEHNRVVLYSVHNPLLDSNRSPIPLPNDPSKFQHGNYLLFILLPKAQKIKDNNGRWIDNPDGSPRDQFYRQFQEEIPEFADDNSIATGEVVFQHLLANTPADEDYNDKLAPDKQKERDNGTYPQNGLGKVKDLLRRLTVPKVTSGRTVAKPENIIVLRADSGFEALYVNRSAKTPRRSGRKTELPDTETRGTSPLGDVTPEG